MCWGLAPLRRVTCSNRPDPCVTACLVQAHSAPCLFWRPPLGAVELLMPVTSPCVLHSLHPHTLRAGLGGPKPGAASRAITHGCGFSTSVDSCAYGSVSTAGRAGRGQPLPAPGPVRQPRTVCHPRLAAWVAGIQPVTRSHHG